MKETFSISSQIFGFYKKKYLLHKDPYNLVTVETYRSNKNVLRKNCFYNAKMKLKKRKKVIENFFTKDFIHLSLK